MPFSPQCEQQANHSSHTHSRWGRFVADERSAPLKHTGADMIHLSPKGFTERRLAFPWSQRRVPPAYWCPSPPIRARGLQQMPRLRTKRLSLARESDLRCNQSRSRGERLWGRCDQSTQGALSSRLGKSRFTCLFVYPDPCWRFNVLRSRNLLQEDNGVHAVACRDGYVQGFHRVEKGRDVDENRSLAEITEPIVGLQHAAQGITPQHGWELRFAERILCTNSGLKML